MCIRDRDTAARQYAVNFSNHGSHPTHVEILLATAVLALDTFFHVTLNRLFPVTTVGHVDGKFLRVFRNLHVGVGQEEVTYVAIQREAVNAVTGGDHHHGVRAVQRVTGTHLLGARLHEIRSSRIGHAFRTTQDGENRTDGDIHVDVGRSIQRIEGDQIFSLWILCRDRINAVSYTHLTLPTI